MGRKNSSRHHYIPKFLINGFKNSNGLLYIFDKQQNKILKKPKPPKSIFFERERNTVEITENKNSSVIEDVLYNKIDNQSSKIIKHYQNEQLNVIKFTPEDNAQFLFFLVTLFWRVPYTDYAAKDIINRATINSSSIDSEVLRSDPTYRKLIRAGLFKQHVDEMLQSKKEIIKRINIHQSQNEIYVIGDNPIFFRRPPKRFSEFNEIDFLVALTSRRIYSSTNNSLVNFSETNSLGYNVAVINQSTRYIACADCNILEQSVQMYNEFKSQHLEYMISKVTFETSP